MFYVVSEDVPTIAMFISMSRAYAFKALLVKQGIQANVVQPESVK